MTFNRLFATVSLISVTQVRTYGPFSTLDSHLILLICMRIGLWNDMTCSSFSCHIIKLGLLQKGLCVRSVQHDSSDKTETHNVSWFKKGLVGFKLVFLIRIWACFKCAEGPTIIKSDIDLFSQYLSLFVLFVASLLPWSTSSWLQKSPLDAAISFMVKRGAWSVEHGFFYLPEAYSCSVGMVLRAEPKLQ